MRIGPVGSVLRFILDKLAFENLVDVALAVQDADHLSGRAGELPVNARWNWCRPRHTRTWDRHRRGARQDRNSSEPLRVAACLARPRG